MNKKFQFLISTLANDYFIAWLWSLTLTFNLPEQMFQMKNCAKLFWNPHINEEVMTQTSPFFYHFIIWPSSVTLTFNLHKQLFQMALVLLKKKNSAHYLEIHAQM